MTERLSDVVREMFTPHGPLARATAFFQPRQGQTDMALAVADTLEKGGSLVVEAGTGVGKTFAYLVPALLSAERVLLSTATKTLQDQLFSRDIPDVIKALGLPLKLAMLKGRGSYLCQQRLELALTSATLPDRHAVKTLAVVQQWARTTSSGDLAEVPSLDEQSALIPLITSNRDNCLGSPCPHWRDCHVNHARREAMAADVVVINHHLFFADMAVRESGMAELLPTVRVVIFDEAHQLNETGIQFLGKQLGTSQLLDLARDTLTAGLQLARGLVDWQVVTAAFEKSIRDWRLVVGKQPANAKLRWSQAQPQDVDAHDWQQALADVSQAAAALQNALDRVMDADVVQSKLLDAQVLTVPDEQQQPTALPRSWIFTSATLGSEPKLRWFTEPCGLQNAQVLQVQSPFDYENQAWLYVPRGMVSPKDPQHSEQVASLSWQVACTLGGRTLVLTTTTRALRAIGDQLMEAAKDNSELDILVQGQHPKRELMQRFRQAIEPGAKGTVLVATASFWEGFDVPGDALQAVIIDKLPFPPPNDPLVEARSQRLESQGRSSFNDYFLPEAGVSLKQGAGRLIRRETDRGALVICDNRLVNTPYGRRLLAVLPPMKRVDQFPALLDALAGITKT